MQPTISRVIILKGHETGETSEVLHVLSEEHGRISLYARGLRQAKGRLRGVLQPLALVEATYLLRDGEEIATLRDATELPPPATLSGDLERLSLGLLLAELGAGLAEPGAPAHTLFGTLLQALGALDPASATRPIQAAVCAIMLLLEAGGTEPSISDELLAAWPKDRPRPLMFWLDVAHGRFHADLQQPSAEPAWPISVPKDAAHIPVPPSALRLVYTMQTGAPLPMLDRECARQLFEALLRFSEWHLGHGLRSAEFWRQMAW
ncbi:DNA repair protein RecO [bacterium]|nr:DNA repair protein RecO [bacterium]